MNNQIRKVLRSIEAMEDTFAVYDTPTYTKDPRKQGPNLVKLWSVPRSSGNILYASTLMAQPTTILELGTSAGYSTIWLAAAAAQYGGHVHTIDSSTLKHRLAAEHIQQAGLQNNISLITSPITEALQAWQQPIDLLFLDADKKNYLAHLKTVEPWFKPGTLVIADNTQDLRAAMTDFIDYISQSPNYHVIELTNDNGMLLANYIG